MSPLFRLLIIIETVVCFGPLSILLAMSLILVPVAFSEAFNGSFWLLPALALPVFGFLGLFAIISLVLHILEPTKVFLKRPKLFLFTAVGIVALLSIIPLFDGAFYGYIMVFLPLLATMHLFYLSRAVWHIGS